MGLTSCRWITIAGTLAHRRRDADRYTLICDEPVYPVAEVDVDEEAPWAAEVPRS